MKKFLACLCSCVFLLTSAIGLAACGKKEDVNHFKIFIRGIDDVENVYTDNPVLNYWAKEQDITTEWISPLHGTEDEQLNLMFNSGDMTDVIDLTSYTGSVQGLGEQGSIYDLSGYIEEHMPNYYTWINKAENEDVKNALYTMDGGLYVMPIIQEKVKAWGGLAYRRDILNKMTNNNIQFPSGEDEPTTIEDWEYMLALISKYFTDNNIQTGAPLVIPASGYFLSGDILSSFGIGPIDYIDNDGNIKFGMMQDAFYDYLSTMKDWFSKGWIYKDFASRSQDPFYYPNTALTYGGTAGVWFALTAMLGNQMAAEGMEDVDVQPIASPKKDDIDPLGFSMAGARTTSQSGFVISKVCSEEKAIRIMEAFDWWFSEEGSRSRTLGLSSEQGAADVEQYTKVGVTNGTRLPNSETWTEEMDNCTEAVNYFNIDVMCGIKLDYAPRKSDLKGGVDYTSYGDQKWSQYGNANQYPTTVQFTPTEKEEYMTIYQSILDYADGWCAKVIMGTQELSKTTFDAFKAELTRLKVERYLEIKKAAYERYTNVA